MMRRVGSLHGRATELVKEARRTLPQTRPPAPAITAIRGADDTRLRPTQSIEMYNYLQGPGGEKPAPALTR